MVTNLGEEEVRSDLARATSMIDGVPDAEVHPSRPGAWILRLGSSELWALYQPDTDATIELVRPLQDLGYAGSILPDEAARHLRAMADASHVRLTRRAHPDASGRIALAAVATLYLEDLDPPELHTTVRELAAYQSTPHS